jgi:hypothetical protein
MCPREDFMKLLTHHGLLLATWMAASPLVHAQATSKAGKPDPSNPMVVVPAATYSSPLARYRPAGEIKLGSWQEANETVTRIGGWRAYAREASQPEPAAQRDASSRPAPAAAPASAPAASGPMPGLGTHGKH